MSARARGCTRARARMRMRVHVRMRVTRTESLTTGREHGVENSTSGDLRGLMVPTFSLL